MQLTYKTTTQQPLSSTNGLPSTRTPRPLQAQSTSLARDVHKTARAARVYSRQRCWNIAPLGPKILVNSPLTRATTTGQTTSITSIDIAAPEYISKPTLRTPIFTARRVGQLMAQCILLASASLLIMSLHQNNQAKNNIAALGTQTATAAQADTTTTSETTATSADEAPVETIIPPSVTATYTVAPDAPRYLNIPSVGVKSARVLRLGLTDSGAIATPKNVWDSGWYEGSSDFNTPGGASLILAHVTGYTSSALFARLSKVAVGDPITVELGNGTNRTYHVSVTEEVAADGLDMSPYLASSSGKTELVLMTCAGSFNQKTRTYDRRFVVRATLAQ